ncbi:fibrinogen-like protein 1, partial [Homarus americanus]|uniref:fibrinogen-like protein 1 n=1 Tax=Homarus americanus TaxID=6706 RepID=UPI001C485155
ALITDKEHTINIQNNTINIQNNTINTQHNTIQNLEERLQYFSKQPVRDCEDVYKAGGKESGVHTIYPKSSPAGVRVYCEVQEGQSWTVFLARHHQTPNENFTRSWQDYKKGFGDPEGEHWLGNENLHTLTGGETRYRLRVEATNLQGEQRYGEWRVFRVAPEDNRYRLTVEQYNSSSTLGDGLNYHNGGSFTTVDRDHDTNPSISKC